MLQTLLSLLSGKLGATAAAAVLTAGTVGAGATDHLPEGLQNAFDAVVSADDRDVAEPDAEDTEVQQAEVVGGDAEATTDVAGEDLTSEETGEDQRSETAEAVHEALTGDADLQPGDEGFGEAVADNARDGGVGNDVADAASGGRSSGEPDEAGEEQDAAAEERDEAGEEQDEAGEQQDEAGAQGRQQADEARGRAGR